MAANTSNERPAKHKSYDAMLFSALMVISVLLMIIFGNKTDKGSALVIRKNGEMIATVALSEDRIIPIDGVLSIVIEGGEVYVSDAVCPDKLCEKAGRISKSGERIVCLPGNVMLEITGEELDAVV